MKLDRVETSLFLVAAPAAWGAVMAQGGWWTAAGAAALALLWAALVCFGRDT